MATFGEAVRERRKELRLGLREFALRTGLDPGNLSKIERGRLNPPQEPAVLDRICMALEMTLDEERCIALKDAAALDVGRLPPDVLADEHIAAQLPLLLRTVQNKRLDADQLARLVELIRES